MSDVISKAKEINLELLKTKEVKEYLNLRKAINDSKYLKKLRSKMDKLQKKVCKDKTGVKDKNEYLRLKEIYDNHYLIIQYESVKREIFSLLKGITDILS